MLILAAAVTHLALSALQGDIAPPLAAAPDAPPPAAPADIAPPPIAEIPVEAAEPAASAPVTRTVHAPAGTPLEIKLTQAISTKTNAEGDPFAFELNAPLIVDGVQVLPAGLKGEGKILYLKRPGLAGRPAELTLTARSLALGGQTIALRGFALGVEGKDRTADAVVVMVAVGLPAFLIRGGHIEIPEGTIGTVKLNADLAATTTAPAPEPNPEPDSQ